ncbi:helix-turn-helix domain-containing protein [Paenibacillus massiliensis]|uniref:helix-turn-helix domain-containing protein n=1 Tax=Paenibacillus massiliensis TaxID=225917 RepID=UPI00055A96FA|nr:helix-turn-helix domain-containing protein [Paenibacillus massiliensis]
MEEKNAEAIVSEAHFEQLIQAARQHDSEAMLAVIELFQPDIQRLSCYIHLPREDAASEIIVEFLEFLQTDV